MSERSASSNFALHFSACQGSCQGSWIKLLMGTMTDPKMLEQGLPRWNLAQLPACHDLGELEILELLKESTHW